MDFSVAAYLDNLKRVIGGLDVASIEKAVGLIREAWHDRRQVILCGYDGGKMKQLAQHSLRVESMEMQICEDLHFVFGHMVMKTLCGGEIRA